MKLNIFTKLILVILLFSSCQKEADFGIVPTPAGAGLLVKVVEKTGTDSTVISYSYNAAKKLIREKISGFSQGTNLDLDTRINRNSAGIITQTVIRSAAFAGSPVDSVVTRYNYNTSTSRYTSSVIGITIGGFTLSDSTGYNYDAAGRIDKDETKQFITLQPPAITGKTEYSYSAGGNLSTVKYYSYDDVLRVFVLDETYNFTYDTKINPMKLGVEGIVLARTPYYSANNFVKIDYIDAADATNNTTTNIVYTYNTDNTPKTSVSTETPSGIVSNITWVYQ
jgi:hypothetical protein